MNQDSPDTEQNYTGRRVTQRMYHLKLWVLLLLIALLSIGLYVIAVMFDENSAPISDWKRSIPWKSLADVALSVVLIGLGYEYFVRRESQQALTAVLKAVSAEERTEISREILHALSLNPESLKHLMSDEVATTVVLAGLEKKLQDAVLARESYESLMAQLLGYDRRLSNYRCRITMAPLDASYDEFSRGRYFEAFVDLRYDCKITRTEYWFTAVSGVEEYNRLLPDSSWELRCVRPPTKAFPADDPRAFKVHMMRINGVDLTLEETTRNGRRSFLARGTSDIEIGAEGTFEYRYSTKMEKCGHVYMQTVICPTRNVVMEFDYALADIGFVNVFDFFVSYRKPSIKIANDAVGPRIISVELNDWVLPKSGVLFGWVLNAELGEPFDKLLAPPRGRTERRNRASIKGDVKDSGGV